MLPPTFLRCSFYANMLIVCITLGKIAFFCLPEVFCEPKICQNAFSAEPRWDSWRQSPDPLVGWRGDTLLRHHPTQRLRRLHSCAFNTYHLCSLPKPWCPRCFRAGYGPVQVELEKVGTGERMLGIRRHAHNIGLFNRKLKSALKCTVWSQCTLVPDRQTDGRTDEHYGNSVTICCNECIAR